MCGPESTTPTRRRSLTCTADTQTFLLYINYSPNKLNNFSLRTEYFIDPQGQRTGVANAYADVALAGSIGFRRKSSSVRKSPTTSALDTPAFNGNVHCGHRSNTGTGRSSRRAT